jgi:uncharacterized membrane protein
MPIPVRFDNSPMVNPLLYRSTTNNCTSCIGPVIQGNHRSTPTQQEVAIMSTIEQSIDIDVPVRTAYDQWTQFEEFPTFMEGVESIVQLDDTHLHWVAEIAGVRREWDAEITEQHPDQRIAWTATDGARNAGVVTFHRISDECTRIMLQLDVEPQGLVERAGDALGIIRRRAEGDLGRFKNLIEGTGDASGAWRGEVDQAS